MYTMVLLTDGHYFSYFAIISHILPLFLIFGHYFSYLAIISHIWPLFLMFCHYFSYFAIISHILPFFLTFCHFFSYFVNFLILWYFSHSSVIFLYFSIFLIVCFVSLILVFLTSHMSGMLNIIEPLIQHLYMYCVYYTIEETIFSFILYHVHVLVNF